ncbi:TetR family transcriptional regulator [Mycobacterium sp. 852013-50091_SCH5140682]|uniref:TetR/AcrR family transcriptional regulator n=1 Tax=Mycobacterium sp. 852013-50091_SCH5140682 TaxID=1834109 RepID=UPI0007EA5BBC|nr:TetR/AcrR family transcriptional regulator [Mycobacterium sp. 852013-50091_SCH5140682]OBC14557.1 TetR family transcriptional regulator [Mycobacterium sp. 852013-50091_SCH5140682]
MSARDTLIASVTGLVRRRGVAGTGLNALLEDSGVSRRSIYLNFPGGKEELVAEATRVAGQALTALIRAADDGREPAEAVQEFIDQWKLQLAETHLEGGCPIVAAVLGRCDAPQAADAAAEAFQDWHTILAERLIRAGADADAARSLATMTIASIEGAVIMAIAAQKTDALDDVGRHLVELTRLHLPNA